MYEMPPEVVPDGLTSQEYYDLGVKYRKVGWIERSREALKRAAKAKKTGGVSKKASTYLRSRIPVAFVPPDAEKRNIEGFNEYIANPAKAKEIFAGLIKDYPDFEWPYSNLASGYIHNGDTKSAIPLLEKAIQLNPCYVNALALLAEAHAMEMNYTEAKRYIDIATKYDPDEPGEDKAAELKRSIEQLSILMADS